MKTILIFVLLYIGLSTNNADAASAPTITPVTAPFIHGEGPFWDHDSEALYFVDMSAKTVNCFQAKTGRVTHFLMDGPTSFVIGLHGHEGCFVVGQDHDIMYLRWDGAANATLESKQATPRTGRCSPVIGRVVILASVDREEGKEGNRFNDAKADDNGRLWAGTMGHEDKGVVTPKDAGTLYSLETTSATPAPRVTGVDISNGIAWNANSTVMYFIDSSTKRVDAFDYDIKPGGGIGNRRTVFDMTSYPNLTGIPDGMTIDSDDNLWVALFKGGAVIKVDPRTGELLQTLRMPCDYVTSVAFGRRSLDTLYVTTSRKDATASEIARQPLAGSLFAVEGLGVTGASAGMRVGRRQG